MVAEAFLFPFFAGFAFLAMITSMHERLRDEMAHCPNIVGRLQQWESEKLDVQFFGELSSRETVRRWCGKLNRNRQRANALRTGCDRYRFMPRHFFHTGPRLDHNNREEDSAPFSCLLKNLCQTFVWRLAGVLASATIANRWNDQFFGGEANLSSFHF